MLVYKDYIGLRLPEWGTHYPNGGERVQTLLSSFVTRDGPEVGFSIFADADLSINPDKYR